MRDTKVHTINGFNYSITQLGAKQGKRVLARVLRLVAGAAEGDASEAVTKLAASLTDEQVDFLCDTFASSTMVAKSETPMVQVPLADQFDNHFAGRYGDMLKWLWAALETNYSSFLSEMGLDTEALKGKAVALMSGTSTDLTAPSGPLSSSKSGG